MTANRVTHVGAGRVITALIGEHPVEHEKFLATGVVMLTEA